MLKVSNLANFFNDPGVFLAFGSEKIHARDFDLTVEGTNNQKFIQK
jgi:hypothetical protein